MQGGACTHKEERGPSVDSSGFARMICGWGHTIQDCSLYLAADPLSPAEQVWECAEQRGKRQLPGGVRADASKACRMAAEEPRNELELSAAGTACARSGPGTWGRLFL
eukprot:149201-Pelagomonas_calceolata.AAC.2